MTIPRLQSFGEELANTLPQLGNSLAHVLNPNLEREKLLQSAIAQDPRILQQLVEQESVNPGALEKMGYGNIAKTIQGMSPGAAFQNKQAIDKATSDAIKADPSLARKAGYRAITGESEEDTKLKGQQIQQNQAALEEIPVLRQKNLAELARIQNENKKGDLANTRRGLAQDWLGQNKGKNVRQIAIDIINGGKISSEVAAGLMENNPAIKEAIDKIKEEDRIKAEKDFISLRNSSNKQDVIERYRASVAAKIYDELDSTEFTYDDLYNHINGKGKGESPEMADKINKALVGMKGDKKGKVLNAVRNSLTAAQGEARRAWELANKEGLKPEAIAGQMRTSAIAIQSALEQLSPLTGKQYSVEFMEKIPKTKNFLGLGGDFGIIIKDQTGKEVDPLKLTGDTNLVNNALGILRSGAGTLQQLKESSTWTALSKDEQTALMDSIKADPKLAKDANGSAGLNITPKDTFSPDTTELPKVSKSPVTQNYPPQLVSLVDSISPGLSQSDSVKALAASDSINAVNEIWKLAKNYVDSKYKEWPVGLEGQRLKAFSDAVKLYRTMDPSKKPVS